MSAGEKKARCAEIAAMLVFYACDEVNERERQQIEEHLAVCELCTRQLAGERGAFTAVGDDDQSIYAWRGANPGNLDELARDYPELKVLKLEQNYRCSARILRAANALIRHNPHVYEKQLWNERGEGTLLRVLACRDSEHEAERIAAEARTKLDDFVARRTKTAEGKIALAEAQALADVRAAATDAAVTAASTILSQSVKGSVADDLLAKGIAEVRAKLN